MKTKASIYYGIILGALLNTTIALFGKIIELATIHFSFSYWLILPMHILFLCVLFYLIFFKTKEFPFLKWWYLGILGLIGLLYYVLPGPLSIMNSEYHVLNFENISWVLPTRSIMNFSMIVLAMIRYYQLQKKQNDI